MGILIILKMVGRGGGVLVYLLQILTGLVVDWYIGVNACYFYVKKMKCFIICLVNYLSMLYFYFLRDRFSIILIDWKSYTYVETITNKMSCFY